MSTLDLPIDYDSSEWSVRKQAREQYMTEQKGLCKHCGVHLWLTPEEPAPINWALFPSGFQKHPVHLHHSHVTGLTIGAIHMYCNAWLWQYKGE